MVFLQGTVSEIPLVSLQASWLFFKAVRDFETPKGCNCFLLDRVESLQSWREIVYDPLGLVGPTAAPFRGKLWLIDLRRIKEQPGTHDS
jgi:hypothetical protein